MSSRAVVACTILVLTTILWFVLQALAVPVRAFDTSSLSAADVEDADTKWLDLAAPAAGEPLPRAVDTSLAPAPTDARTPHEGVVVMAGTVFDVTSSAAGVARTPAASVRVVGFVGQGGGGELAPTMTDAHGRFRFELRDFGQRPLLFEAAVEPTEHTRGATASFVLREREFEKLDLVLVRVAKGDLVVRTLEADGRRVADVRVELAMDPEPRTFVSDADGEFRIEGFEGLRGVDPVRVEREGCVLLHAQHPDRRPDGGWSEMHVVLAPASRLTITVRDGEGRGIADASVSAFLSPIERFGRRRFELGSAYRTLPRAVTDASGVARIESVCANQRLEVFVAPSSSVSLSAAKHDGGRLVFDERAPGSPIVVAANEELALQAVLPWMVDATGRVQDENGSGLSGVAIEIAPANGRHAPFSVRSGDDGRFALRFPCDASAQRFRVTASHRRRGDGSLAATSRVATTVDWVAGKPLEIALVVPPALTITGRAIDREGNAVRGVAFAYERRTPALHDDPPKAVTSKSGSFELGGLLSGVYDVRFRPNERWSDVWILNVEAGTDALEFLCDRERDARVTVDVSLRGGGTAEIEIVCERIGRRDAACGAPAMPEKMSCSDFTGFAPWIGGAWHGDTGDAQKIPLRDTRATTIALDAGCYRFGASARTKDGAHYFPIGTRLLRVDAGDHRLSFELARAVRVEGRVHAPRALDLAVALAWRNDELLELDKGYGEASPVRELGADGGFAFELVPESELELWIGTPAELRAGRPRHREKITVHDGMPFVEVNAGG